MGTSKIGSNIDRDGRKVVSNRSQIWEAYDRANADITELNSYAKMYGNANITENLAALTSENTPPTEIAAVLTKLEVQESIVDRATLEIKANLAEIKATKQQFVKVVGISLILGGLILSLINIGFIIIAIIAGIGLVFANK